MPEYPWMVVLNTDQDDLAISIGKPVQPQREIVSYFDKWQDAATEEERRRAAERHWNNVRV